MKTKKKIALLIADLTAQKAEAMTAWLKFIGTEHENYYFGQYTGYSNALFAVMEYLT